MLVCNTPVIVSPLEQTGFELTMAVNHLAHQLLVMRLMPLLHKSLHPRLVIRLRRTIHQWQAMAAGWSGTLAGLAEAKTAAMVDGPAPLMPIRPTRTASCATWMALHTARLHPNYRSVGVLDW